jgi:hypothetical protein
MLGEHLTRRTQQAHRDQLVQQQAGDFVLRLVLHSLRTKLEQAARLKKGVTVEEIDSWMDQPLDGTGGAKGNGTASKA